MSAPDTRAMQAQLRQFVQQYQARQRQAHGQQLPGSAGPSPLPKAQQQQLRSRPGAEPLGRRHSCGPRTQSGRYGPAEEADGRQPTQSGGTDGATILAYEPTAAEAAAAADVPAWGRLGGREGDTGASPDRRPAGHTSRARRSFAIYTQQKETMEQEFRAMRNFMQASVHCDPRTLSPSQQAHKFSSTSPNQPLPILTALPVSGLAYQRSLRVRAPAAPSSVPTTLSILAQVG